MNTSSIKKRLLIAVLFIVTVFWVLVEAVMFFSIKDEVDEMFDSQLAQAAAMVAEISLTPLHKYDGEPLVLSRAIFGHKYERKISFQIWRDGRLLSQELSPEAWRSLITRLRPLPAPMTASASAKACSCSGGTTLNASLFDNVW